MRQLSAACFLLLAFSTLEAQGLMDVPPVEVIEKARAAVTEEHPELDVTDKHVSMYTVVCNDNDIPEYCTAVVQFIIEATKTNTKREGKCFTEVAERTLQVAIHYDGSVLVSPETGTSTRSSYKTCE